MEGIRAGINLGIFSLIILLVSHSQAQDTPQMKEEPSFKSEVRSFDLSDVQLLESPFKRAMEKDRDYLLTLQPDRLLSRCREYAGLAPKDSAYGGWERETISSHSLGHYLSACALQFRASGDKRFLDRVNYIVDELSECQKANGNGYVAGIPNGKKVFAEVAAGDIRSKGFDLNGLWVPWYVLHKIMAGLREAHLLCNNLKAKDVMVGIADFAYETTKHLNEEQFQRMLDCEHGGMNEVLADVYALTRNQKYLDLAKKFYHHAVMDPLSRKEDQLCGRHGNTNIPKLIGAARIYELTGEENFGTSSAFFWETVVHNHSYVCGGHGESEYFGEPRKLNDRLSDNTMETCNSYNMLKLTRFLFMREPKSEYVDFFERTLYNHILASQNPDDGMVCYFVPLASGTYKQYSSQFDDFSCCLGTGMENHSKYGESIYFHADNELYINLFIPSELTWHAKNFKLRQTTDFPKSGKTLLEISCPKPERLTLKIRRPYWATEDFQIKVGGRIIDIQTAPKNYITIEREWRDGDILEIIMPLKLRLESMPDNPGRVAVMFGPIVLAGDLGPIDSQPDVPVMITNSEPVNTWVKPVTGKELTFTTNNAGRPYDATLIPFYRMHNRRHGVYWDLYTEEEFKEREKAIIAEKARKKELESRTADIMRIGEMQPERDHNLQGEKTYPGETMDHHWRMATDGGWFSFEMKCLPDKPLELCATYWGSENRNREFEIYIDGEKIASQILENNKPGEYFDQIYTVSETITNGKENITVKFQALSGKHTGRLFGCRILYHPTLSIPGTQPCNCPYTIYTDTTAKYTFNFKGGESIVVCGYNDTDIGKNIFSEFILYQCGQDNIIDFWGAVMTCRLSKIDDTLLIEHLDNLPILKGFQYSLAASTIEKIYFIDDNRKRVFDFNHSNKYYSENEIKIVLHEFETSESKITDKIEDIICKLYVASISDDKKAQYYFLSLRNKYPGLDGAYLELYERLLENYKSWKKIADN